MQNKKKEDKDEEECLFKIGVISDIQYCDCDDGENYQKTVIRHYRESLKASERGMEDMKREGVDCVISLGDIVDGRCKRLGQAVEAVEKVKRVLEGSGVEEEHIHHLMGNHEHYNFTSNECNLYLNTGRGINGNNYYHFTPIPSLTIILLDCLEVSVCHQQQDSWQYQQADTLLKQNNSNYANGHFDWGQGIQGTSRRFQPFNGDISDEQYKWVEYTLTEAEREGRKVIVMGHIPINVEASSNNTLLFNYKRLADLLGHFHCTVLMYMAGHHHPGGQAYDQHHIYHSTLSSPLNCHPSTLKTNHAIIYVYQHHIYIQGYGQIKSATITFNKQSKQIDNQ